jgi:nucleoside-diphosphate-sugar epimerase
MPKMYSKRIMVIGATGQIGSELVVELRKKYSGDRVIAVGHERKPNGELLNSAPFEYIDVTQKMNIKRIVEKYDIDTVYHLASVLSATGEKNPELAWNVNLMGLHNVLEVAIEHKINRVFWPSSIAVFGPESPRIKTPQETILIPRTMYGVTKVAGELLCNYYFIQYGLDVRSIRYPGIISMATLPSGGTTDYAVAMLYEAIRKNRYTCFVRKDTVLPMMYMPDCLKATINLMEADANRIKHRIGYNVSAMSFSAGELAEEIRKYIPDFKCEFKPDFRQKIADSWPVSVDDSLARDEWGWKPDYNLTSMTKDVLQKKCRAK